jgi:predicted NBD/HSP70 family sugar kinase
MAVACGMALPHLYKQKISKGMVSKLSLPEDFDVSKIDGKLLKQGLDIGDPVSKEIILESGRYVGIGIYNIFQALNPPLVVLGGGLMSWGDSYLAMIKSTFYAYARDMIFDPFKITVSTIGTDVGVIGAASLVLES